MINLIDKLSDLEKIAIDNYCQLAYTHFEIPERLANFEDRFSYWSKNKQELYDILQNNLILERPICLTERSNAWLEQFDMLYKQAFFSSITYDYMVRPEDIKDYFTKEELANNILSKDLILYPKNVNSSYEPIKLKKGMKMMKAFKKIAEALNTSEYYEKLRLAHSELLQEKRIKGTLCLSIHPLDFLTMSDNANKWSSCMSIKRNGEYCAGVIEMMNSPLVVCVYLKGNKEMVINEYCGLRKWNSKKWRCLFIVENDIIFPIKGYPYQSPALESMALDWLKELLEQKGYKYHPTPLHSIRLEDAYYRYPEYDYYCTEDKKCYLSFKTNIMYNDTGMRDQQYYVSENLYNRAKAEELTSLEINYSGPFTCMWCGEKFELIDKPEMITCCRCRHQWYCDICGEVHFSEDAIHPYYGDMHICDHCLADAVDTLDGYRRVHGDCIQVIAIPSLDLIEKVELAEEHNWITCQFLYTAFPHAYISKYDYQDAFKNLDSAYHPMSRYVECINEYVGKYFHVTENTMTNDSWTFMREPGHGVNKNWFFDNGAIFITLDSLTPEGREIFFKNIPKEKTFRAETATKEQWLAELRKEISYESGTVRRRTFLTVLPSTVGETKI